MSFEYTPDEVKVHQNAINLLCKEYQSHESGIPEWLKNSSDEYARRDSESQDRVVVLLFQDRLNGMAPAIGCLDFGGMDSVSIETRFRIWADPNAAGDRTQFKGVQGGHGNGGKCYMTQMFRDYALIHTVSKGMGCRYGVAGGTVAFGYVPNIEKGKDYPVQNIKEELSLALAPFGITSEGLPKRAQDVLARTNGFTLALGVGPRDYSSRIPVKKLLQNLQTDPQMVETLQACSILVIINGQKWNKGHPLELPPIEPLPSARDPLRIEIPSKLVDPATDTHVSTTGDGKYQRGVLTLRTSKTNMQQYKRRRSRHSVTFRSSNGFLGFVPVPELGIDSIRANYIYGECVLDSLEQYKTNNRTSLARSPLTRAVENFIKNEIRKLAQELEQRDRSRYTKKERKLLSDMNAALNEWKNQFLAEILGGTQGVGAPLPPAALPRGTPHKLVLSVTHKKMGRGVFMRPQLKFYDSDGRRIRAVPVQWHVDDPNVLMVNELGLVNSFTYGNAKIWAETLDGGITSNPVSIQVVHIRSIRVEPAKVEVPMGGRTRLEAICTCEDGIEHRDVLLIWTEDDDSIARVSSSGTVFGASLGETSVTAGDDAVFAEARAHIIVTRGSGGGAGKGRGRGFPLVLISGVNVDPDTNEVVELSSGEPPIWQRPEDVDRNIWWINSASPLARLYRDEERGFGFKSTEWRIYHVERYIDLISHIVLAHEMEQSELPAEQWYINRGAKMVEIQERAAEQLTQFIESGDLPEM